MSVTKVYRYEHPETGVGPYNNYLRDGFQEHVVLANILGSKHTKHIDTHPGASWEIHEDEVCACKTRKALVNWFRGFNNLLNRHGYKIAEYTIEEAYVREGSLQVYFNPDEAIEKRYLGR